MNCVGSSSQQGKRYPESIHDDLTRITGEPKRRRLSDELRSDETIPLQSIPDIPLLYYTAVTAHHAAQNHLQQAFIPPDVICEGKNFSKINTPSGAPFCHDPAASGKAMGLLLLSLQLLKIGLNNQGISFVEKVGFGLEFGIVGLKVLRELDRKGKNSKQLRDTLVNDLQEIIGSSLSIAHRNPHLKSFGQTLEVLNARLAYQENRANLAKRMIRQIIKDTPSTDFAYKYTLLLLLLEFSADDTSESLGILNELIMEASQRGCVVIVQLAHLARLRILFVHRRWEVISDGLEQLAHWLGWPDDSAINPRGDSVLRAHVEIHYLFFRCLWEGRIGNDNLVKTLLRKAYLLMDSVADRGIFHQNKADGGILEVPVDPSHSIQLQVTPPNIVYLMTFVVTLVCRKDYLGKKASCKSLVHASAGREFAQYAKRDDIWDIGFNIRHSPSDSAHLQRHAAALLAELLLEEVFALTYRMDMEEVDILANRLIDHLRFRDLFTDFAAHLALLFATRIHLLGYSDLATRYYMACERLILPGSELALVVKIGQFSAQGLLCSLTAFPSGPQMISNMADQCRASTSATMQAVGHFLACLSDNNLANSKKKLSQAYDISQRANNNVLRTLIFAFTTSTHWTGSDERILKQLETGRDVAAMMGGLDREDKVGQLSLGLWFAVKLKRWYRMNDQPANLEVARRSAEAHIARLRHLSQEGQKRFRQLSRLGLLDARGS